MKQYHIMQLLVTTENMAIISGLVASEAVILEPQEPAPELLEKHGLLKDLSPFQANGKNSHQALMEYLRENKDKTCRFRDMQQYLLQKGWSKGAAGGCLKEFVRRGWVITVSRGMYRLTMTGLTADVSKINFFKERLNAVYAAAS
jgi:hypothetical protein